MQDLNDLYYFAKVVERGSFAAAARTLDLPKSRLSRRVATLESRSIRGDFGCCTGIYLPPGFIDWPLL